jgi:hypothetical protein
MTGRVWRYMMHDPETDGAAPIEEFAAAIAHLRATGTLIVVSYFEATLAAWMARAGQIDAARTLAQTSVTNCHASRLLCWYPEILRLQAEVEMIAGNPESAARALAEAAQVSDRQGSLLWGLRIALDSGAPERIRQMVEGFPPGVHLPELQAAQARLA